MYFLVKNLGERWVEGDEAAVMFAHRLDRGEEILVTNLQGKVAPASIMGYDKTTRRFRLSYGQSEFVSPPDELTVMQGIIDKLYLEKLVEVLGYTDITTLYLLPLERSQAQKIDPVRLLKILQRAVLLSERAWMPKILPVSSRDEVINLLNKFRPIVLQASSQEQTKSSSTHSTSILIGPEGGFSPSELTQFAELTLPTLSLGTHIYPGWLAGFVALNHLSEV